MSARRRPPRRPIRPAPPAFECRSVCVCVTFVTCEGVCVALVAIAGRRYTYTVCTYYFLTSRRALARLRAAMCKALSVCVCVLAFVAVSGSLIYIYRDSVCTYLLTYLLTRDFSGRTSSISRSADHLIEGSRPQLQMMRTLMMRASPCCTWVS